MSADSETSFDDFAVTAMPRLRRVAYAWCHDWHHSEDVVQDTMERVYAAWPRVRRGGQEYAYARTTLVRRLISENRRAWRRHESSAVDEETFNAAADVHPIPDTAADSAARLDTTDLLARLPLRQRAVAVLRFVEELPVAQVAELLGCSQGTVKSQAHHARTALRAAGLVQAAPVSTAVEEQPPPSTHRGG
ncbi:sigma-70 family RNA polymerase sigma factor [Kineococcus sp. NBC_00420]|uniref:RNA polymerase sigma factor n=1 Tax=Kineococcus sp. NBC_00420 TaxID=2903564 RepID=UPI002E1F81EF